MHVGIHLVSMYLLTSKFTTSYFRLTKLYIVIDISQATFVFVNSNIQVVLAML